MIKVLIVEDRKIIQHLLKHCLANYSDIEIVGIVNNGKLGVEQAELLEPDVIIMDIEMPEMNGLEASKIIIAKNPQANILIFSLHEEREYIERAMAIGVRGYLLKTTSPDEMSDAIRAASKGDSQQLEKRSINTSEGIYLSLNSNGKSAIALPERTTSIIPIEKSFKSLSVESVNNNIKVIEQDIALFGRRIQRLEKNTNYYRKIIVYLIVLSGILALALVAAILI